MKSKLSILIDLSDERAVYFNLDSIISLGKLLGKVNLIDVSKIIKQEIKVDPHSINKDLIIHRPNNINELNYVRGLLKSNILIQNLILKSFKLYNNLKPGA